MPFKFNGQTTVTFPGAATVATKVVTVANLTSDFATSPAAQVPRNVVFKTITVECLPVGGPTLALGGVTMQLYAVDLAGNLVALTAIKALSFVNPTRLSMRVPLWLLGPQVVSSSNPVFAVSFNSAVPISTTYTIDINIKADGDVTMPEIVPF